MIKHAIYKSLINALRGAQFAPVGSQVTLSDDFKREWLPILEKAHNANLSELFEVVNLEFYYPRGFLEEIEAKRGHSPLQIIQKGVVPLPSEIQNRLISGKLFKMFGDKLGEAEGFKKVQTAGMFQPEWRFAFTTKDYPNGLIVPIRENNRITRLKIYKHLQDKNGFLLASDEQQKAA